MLQSLDWNFILNAHKGIRWGTKSWWGFWIAWNCGKWHCHRKSKLVSSIDLWSAKCLNQNRLVRQSGLACNLTDFLELLINLAYGQLPICIFPFGCYWNICYCLIVLCCLPHYKVFLLRISSLWKYALLIFLWSFCAWKCCFYCF